MGVIDQVAVLVVGGLRILEDLVSSGFVLGGFSANLTQDNGDGVVFGATVA